MEIVYRSQDLEHRSLNERKRCAEFVVATEAGVPGPLGHPEYLRMAGLELGRYLRNPIVLDSHDRSRCSAIVGSAKASVERNELVARITYARTKRADAIWELVKTGFLGGCSIGYGVVRARELRPGESDVAGGSRVDGPATLIEAWELFEISMCPVPADQNALIRQSTRVLRASDDAFARAFTGRVA